MKNPIYCAAVAAALMLTAGAGSARADIIYQLDVDNCSGGGCNPSPGTSMGTVTLHTVAPGNVLVTIDLVSPLKFVNTGLDDVIDFNITGAPTIAVTNFSNANFQLNSGGVAGSHHFDGFGNFEYSIGLLASLGSGAGSAQPSPLSFNVIAPGLTMDSFTTNAGGWLFGVDVYNSVLNRTGPIGTGSGGTLSTGGGAVPEPTSILLLGTVLVGFTKLWRSRSKAHA